jgi:hypothetical protein
MQPGFVPPVDSSELRPKPMWFFVAAGIGVVGIVAGVLMLIYGIGGISAPMIRTFGEGETVSVRLDQDTAIYTADGATRYEATCVVTSADGKPVPTSTVGYSFTKQADGRQWQLLRTFPISTPGDYRVACTEARGPYAIADQPDVSRFVVGMVSLFALSGLGIVIGAVLAVVVGVKRGNHRRRLLDERLRRA